VVMALALPDWWYRDGVGVAMLGWRNFLEVAGDVQGAPPWQALQAGILVRAPHPAQARAFALWLRDLGGCGVCSFPTLDRSLQDPAKIAAGALGYVLQGDGLSDLADADAAKFSPQLAQRLALAAPAGASLDGLRFRMDVTDAAANDRLAVVSMRVVGSAPQAFGVVYARVILRKNAVGLWKVLQISPNVAPGSRWSTLKTYTAAVTPAKVSAVSVAAPIDGDNRPPQPDLWWDNSGAGGLLVVEWQINLGGWTDTRLMFVPDHDPRVQTRVNASFARMAGEYRWRVWSVGRGGAMALSPWRTLNIVR
jgi:hypothetical protein